MKKINCLLIKTPDQRCFFTAKANYPQLVEFARVCDAEISVVKAQKVKVLELPDLALSICSHEQSTTPEYEVVEVKIAPGVSPKASRDQIRLQAEKINSYLRKNLLKGKTVSIADLESKLETGLSKSALCNHIARTKKEMVNEGYSFKKIGRGQYKIINAK